MKNRMRMALAAGLMAIISSHTKANTLTLDLSGLIPIGIEHEEAVDDPNCYRSEVPVLRFEVTDFKAGLEEEDPVNDIRFLKTVTERNRSRLCLDQWLLMEPEAEEPVALSR